MRFEKLLPEKQKAGRPPKSITKENDTAAKILNAATELFMQHGFKEVTLRDIAAHAQVNLSLISYYYGTKENLGNAVYDVWASSLFGEVEKVDLDGFSDVEQLYISCALAVRYMFRSPYHRQFIQFYYEYIESKAMILMPTRFVERKAENIIDEYGLDVTREENKLYLELLKLTENHLTLKYAAGDRTVSEHLLMKLSFSNYFYNIGLSDETIAEAISAGTAFLDEFRFDFEKTAE